MALTGVAVRPAGSDSYWPPVGTRVPWRLHGVIQQMYDQAKARGVAVKGTIGNVDHLRKHGGHTPWEPGKPRGVLHAIDLEAPGLGDFILAVCRTDEDTSYIQFLNWRGRQYDHGGGDVGSSGDWHLHFHVKAGAEQRVVDLIERYATRNAEEDDMYSDEDRARDKNTNGRVAEVYPIKDGLIALNAKMTAVLTALGEDAVRDAEEQARDAAQAAQLAEQHAEVLAAITAVPGMDPAVWAERVAQLLIPHLPEGVDAAAFLDALRARLES